MSKSLNKYRAFRQTMSTYVYNAPRRQLSDKQRQHIQILRAKNEERWLNKYAEEAARRFKPTAESEDEFNADKYKERLKISARIQNMSISQVHKSLMHIFPYTTYEENYKYQIFEHVDKTELKRRIVEAEQLESTTTSDGKIRVEGGFNWEEYQNRFQYDQAGQCLIGQFTNGTIKLTIQGGNSDSPDFVRIE